MIIPLILTFVIVMSLQVFSEGLKKAIPSFKLSLQLPALDDSNGGDSKGSLINLLNFAQETATGKTNKRFAESAERLRNQFLRSITARYDLTTGPFAGGLSLNAMDTIIAGLTNINDVEQLNDRAKTIHDVILMQLRGIDPSSGPDTILFYNEPMECLAEFRYNAPFARDCLDRVSYLESSATNSANKAPHTEGAATPREAVRSQDIMNSIRRSKAQELAASDNTNSNNSEAPLDSSRRDGYTEGSGRRRKRDIFIGAVRSLNPFKRDRGKDSCSSQAEEEEAAAFLQQQSELLRKAGLSEDERSELQLKSKLESNTRSAREEKQAELQAAQAASMGRVLARAKAQREAENPGLLAQQAEDVRALKMALRKEIEYWRFGGDGKVAENDSRTDTGVPRTKSSTVKGVASPRMEFPLASEAPAASPRAADHASSSTYSRWRTVVEAQEQAKYTFPNPRTLLYDGKGEFSSTHPNYACLLHSCLLLSLATYNLQLAGKCNSDNSSSSASWLDSFSSFSKKDFNPWNASDWTSRGLSELLSGMMSEELRGVVDFFDQAVAGMAIDNMHPTLESIRSMEAEVKVEREREEQQKRKIQELQPTEGETMNGDGDMETDATDGPAAEALRRMRDEVRQRASFS